jgi:hypothetical protein
MFRRRRPVENRIVSRRMGEFFTKLSADDRRDPVAVAEAYGRHLFAPTRHTLLDEKKLSTSRFSIGITAKEDRTGFERLTRRATLISDTLLLTHNWAGAYHELGVRYILDLHPPKPQPRPLFGDWKDAVGAHYAESTARAEERRRNNRTQTYGMHCPDVEGLGRWILDAEPLLTAGLAWYLPSYSLSEYKLVDGRRQNKPSRPTEQLKAADVVVRNGRVVDGTGELPLKSHLVREVLRADIPFIDGVTLRDFGRITVDEFGSYTAFRDFMRLRLLTIDSALDDVRSERALATIGIEIADGFRSVRADLEGARHKRAVAATGAVLGSVSAVLVAVYGPALAAAVAAVGAGGGLWGVISAMADNSLRQVQENKWYYVWALSRKADHR